MVASSRDYQSTGRWLHSVFPLRSGFRPLPCLSQKFSPPAARFFAGRRQVFLTAASSASPSTVFLVSLAFSFSRDFRFAQPVLTPCGVSQKFLLVLSFHSIASVCFTRSVFLASDSKAAACSACVSYALPSRSELLPWLSGNQANRCYDCVLIIAGRNQYSS
jgi:hypothetical protein